jgi:hypothetical protein
VQRTYTRDLAALVAFVAFAACVACRGSREPAPWSDAWLAREAERYLGETDYRRRALEASLVNPENVYSRQRLKAYGHDTSGWDALPVWNPRSRPVDRATAEALVRGEWPALPAARIWDGSRPATRAEWVALGRRVFFEFPLRPEFAIEHVMTPDRLARAETVGVERTAAGDLPGVVVFDDVDGTHRVGITCAICHSTVRDGVVVEGAARRRFDIGTLRLDFYRETGDPVDPELARRMAAWGPGRADVTEDDDEDPVAIPDLWGLRHETFLTHAGTIRHVGPAALAIRQETQLLHASGLRIRPPRELAWALTMYLYAIEPPPARVVTDTAAVARGAKLFDAHCRLCHDGPILAGDPIAATQVGTDPSLADGKARGTGRYRVTSLVRVADAAPYLHDGSVPSLELLLSSQRPVRGHLYGVDLPAVDRDALLRFLETQ